MDRYRVKPGAKVRLQDWNPNDTSAFKGGKARAEKRFLHLNRDLEELQELLYAEHKHKVLIVLQGMDASGKDSTIRYVFDRVNPQGVRVASFKVPTPQELDHDYLWRVHKHVPGKGEMVIFNRSHYGDVLVVRVRNLVPRAVWRRRYAQIRNFERMLAEEGTTILKFFLHIDRKEQKKRFEDRLNEPDKHWKFNAGDLEERKLWDEYTRAYEDALEKTSTDAAPWYVVPANRKWYRNLVISSVVVETLRALDMKHREPRQALDGIVID